MSAPYKVLKNEIYGRYLVATRDLKEGELILKENPVMVGPQIDASLICFKCSGKIDGRLVICKKCRGAIFCSENCKGNLHSEKECEAIQNCGITCEIFLKHPQIIMVVRCFLLKFYNLEKWEEILCLESHIEHRQNTFVWRMYQNNVVDVLEKESWICNEDNLLQKVCGILDVNTFEIRPSNVTVTDPSDCLRGLYLTPALMTHDCTPNTHLSVDENFQMTIHVSKPIKENEMILFNYANGLQGSYERRRHLKEGKYFDCVCKRCSDETEFGTNLSSLLCPKCKIGYLCCSKPLSNAMKVDWTCQSCNENFNGNLINTTINLCKDKINECSSMEKAEETLKKLKLTLTPNHYILLELKQNLISMLTASSDDEASMKKIVICEEMLEILKVIEPGISRHQGIVCYELYNAKLACSNKAYQNKELNTSGFLIELKAHEGYLKEALKSLIYEPRQSPEGRLTQKAMNDLRVLRRTIVDVTKILENNDTQTNQIII